MAGWRQSLSSASQPQLTQPLLSQSPADDTERLRALADSMASAAACDLLCGARAMLSCFDRAAWRMLHACLRASVAWATRSVLFIIGKGAVRRALKHGMQTSE